MKLATVLLDGLQRVGCISSDETRIELLTEEWSDLVDIIAAGINTAEATMSGQSLPLSSVRLLAPIPRPRRNIMCVGKNYLEHAKEFARSGYEAGAVAGKDLDEYPALFSKLPSSVIGPGEKIQLHPTVTQKVDLLRQSWRSSLAIAARAWFWNFRGMGSLGQTSGGIPIINDVTFCAATCRKTTSKWFLGKVARYVRCRWGPGWSHPMKWMQHGSRRDLFRERGRLRQAGEHEET